MIEHFGKSILVRPCVSIAKPEVAVDATSPALMVSIIGTVQGKSLGDAKVRLDEIQPRGIGRRPHRHDLVCGEILHEYVTLVMREIVHDHIEPHPLWIGRAQSLEGRQQIRYPLALMDRAGKAITVHVKESQELFRS